MTENVDVVVIGMGPGGEEVAGKLAEAGLRVVGVERELVGGECPYWGCIPSKMIIRAANLIAEARRIPGVAGAADVRPDFGPVAKRIRDEATDDWDDIVAVDRFVGKGGQFIRGSARLDGPGAIVVGAESFTARLGVVIATGTVPSVPPVPGLADTPFWSNRDAVAVTEPPASLLVLGGGAIGLEFAQAFARFGSTVTIVEVADRLAAQEEPESSEVITEVLRREGITVHTGAKVTGAAYDGTQFSLTVNGGELRADQLLVAAGRRAALGSLGLDSVGLDPGGRWLETDDHQRAGEQLWAVGDITGKGAFTHVAMYQAGIAVRAILGENGPPADYRALPRVTFTDPEIGAVGLTEAGAREAKIPVKTGIAQVPSTARGWIHGPGNDGFIKLVQDSDRGVLVGATSAGPVGGEVLGALAVAVHAQVPTQTLAEMIYAYPTFHRGIEDALRDLHG